MSDQPYSAIEVPREGVNDDFVMVVEWLVTDGDKVDAGQPVVVIETTKSAVDLESPAAGFAFQLVPAGTDARVGTTIGVVAATAERPTVEPAQPSEPADDQIVTAGAQALITQHGLSASLFAGLDVVRTSDVEEQLRLRDQGEANAPVRRFLGELLSEDADWDAVLTDQQYQALVELLTRLRKRMKARFNRHVSVGDLLHDRWDLAREYGFGEGTSVYDDCLVLGDVVVGENCWVGPHCVLDGSGGLVVGDFVDVGAGSHLYSHNTIERALTGHKQPIFYKSTRIGSRCFIGPNSIVAPGTVLGDGCFVAAGSYVEGVFPDHSYIGGSPASILGTVEVTGDHARIRPFEKD